MGRVGWKEKGWEVKGGNERGSEGWDGQRRGRSAKRRVGR